MSFGDLKKIAESTVDAGSKRQQITEGRNVALAVQEFNLEKNTTIGKNIATGEIEEIRLREDKKERKYARSDVPEWSGNSEDGNLHKSYIVPGGVIVFESVFSYPDGLTARWGTVYSHNTLPKKTSKVVVAPAAPFVTKNKKYGMDVVKTKQAKLVQTLDELKQAMIAALTPDYTSVMVRMLGKNEDGADEIVVCYDERGRMINRSLIVDGQYVTVTAEEAVDNFLEKNKFGQTLTKSIGTNFITEVVAIQRLFAGRDTNNAMGDEDHYLRNYKTPAGVGFTDTILALRNHKEGGIYLSQEPLPTSTLPKLYAIADLPTAHIVPNVTPYQHKRDQDANGGATASVEHAQAA